MKVGNRDVIFNETILIPHGEFAKFSCQLAKDDIINVKVTFTTEELNQIPRMESTYVDQEFLLNFINFNSSIGHSTSEPVHIADSNKGEPIFLIAVVSRLKYFIKIEFQMMMEKSK